MPGDSLALPKSCRIVINGNPKAVTVVLGLPAGWEKEPHKIFKGYFS
jgi:hypothetical protein